MARPREFDTDQALATIAEQFWVHGYEATSITDLEEVTGLARARLYAAFGSKAEMLHRSMDRYMHGDLEEVFTRIEAAGLDGIGEWFTTVAALRSASPGKVTKGCLVVNSLIELAHVDGAVRTRGDRYFARILQAFRTALEVSADRGELEGDPDQRAQAALMLLLGMFVSVKSGASSAMIDDLAAAAVAVVESWRVTDSAMA